MSSINKMSQELIVVTTFPIFFKLEVVTKSRFGLDKRRSPHPIRFSGIDRFVLNKF